MVFCSLLQCPQQAAKARIVVGIDFGTYGTGFAYAVNTTHVSGSLQPGISECWTYADHPHPKMYPKTLTALLYCGRKATDFGYTAQRKWNELTPLQRTDGSHHYVTGAAIKLGLNDAIAAPEALPPGISAVTAAADFLSLFRRFVVAHLGAASFALLGTSLTSDMIQVGPVRFKQRVHAVPPTYMLYSSDIHVLRPICYKSMERVTSCAT